MAIPKVRSVAQIKKTLTASQAPRRRNIQKMIAAERKQQAADIKGLEATQRKSFGNITQGASNRGLLFSGIPLGEQAEYTATQFLPAVARRKTQGAGTIGDLRSSLLSLNEDALARAISIQEREKDRRFQALEAQKAREAAEREAARARAAARAASGGGFSPTLGFDPTTATGGGGGQEKQRAMADVGQLMNRKGTADFYREIQAINQSAGYGNQYDKMKLQLLRSSLPGMFQNNKLNTGYVSRLINLVSNPHQNMRGGSW